MVEPIRIEVHYDPTKMSYPVIIRGVIGGQHKAAVLDFMDIEPGYVHPIATELDDAHAQLLMDSLWRAGLRPSDQGLARDVIEAQGNHILTLQKDQEVLLRIALSQLEKSDG